MRYKNHAVYFLLFYFFKLGYHIIMTNIIIACFSRRLRRGWVLVRCIFSDGMCFVLLMFLNKAFITAWPAQASSALSNVNWVGWLLEPWLPHVWMYHWSPTSLSFCIIMTVVTYSTFSWTGGTERVGGFLEGWWGRAGGGRSKADPEDRGEKEATLKLHDHCETFRSILMIYFFMGEKSETSATALLLSLRLFFFSDIKRKKKNQPLSSHGVSCPASGLLMD